MPTIHTTSLLAKRKIVEQTVLLAAKKATEKEHASLKTVFLWSKSEQTQLFTILQLNICACIVSHVISITFIVLELGNNYLQ